MNTQEQLSKQARAQEWRVDHHHSNPVILVILVTLGSFMVGLIPITYASAFGNTQSSNPTIVGEAGLWSVFGEKEDTSSGVPRQ